ncbi:DUF2971 domain-containing protein [Idiomarina sp.]|uniref:DUF2971 domain-containing protein n=1 Tax=Idiomarina sp. TaxID=1874361 RepID=UPI002EB8D0DD|nr:DUF2971 domain-containing protein [Pseudomonadota bacterium]
MFQFLKEHNKYLYHYTSVEKAVKFILKNRTLMFNSLRGTNDPKEYKNWKFDFHIENNLSPTHEESIQLWHDVSDEIKTKCKVLCFSKDMSGLGENFLNDIYLRGYSKPRMWAQYGDRHKGLCLIFDRERIKSLLIEQFDKKAELYGSDITYRNSPLKGDIVKSPYTLHYPLLKELGVAEYVKRHINTHNSELIFEKSLDWKDENEFRFLMLIDSENNQFLNYNNALKGIVFGADTEEEDQRRVFQLTYKGGTQFEQILYSNGTPWYSFKDFRAYHA